MSRIVARHIEFAGEDALMNRWLPAWLVWCIAAAINALIWTEIFQLGSWLSGRPASIACLFAVFLTITAFGFICQMLLGGGRNGS